MELSPRIRRVVVKEAVKEISRRIDVQEWNRGDKFEGGDFGFDLDADRVYARSRRTVCSLCLPSSRQFIFLAVRTIQN